MFANLYFHNLANKASINEDIDHLEWCACACYERIGKKKQISWNMASNKISKETNIFVISTKIAVDFVYWLFWPILFMSFIIVFTY